MVIKIILIVAVLVIAYFLVKSTSNTKNVALRRLLLVVFVLLALGSILFPDTTTAVAHWVGVGRGADLILYLLVISFLSYAVVSYRRMNIFENRITDLARELAIARSQPQGSQFEAPGESVPAPERDELAGDNGTEPGAHERSTEQD